MLVPPIVTHISVHFSRVNLSVYMTLIMISTCMFYTFNRQVFVNETVSFLYFVETEYSNTILTNFCLQRVEIDAIKQYVISRQ